MRKSGMSHILKLKGGEDNRHSEMVSIPASIHDPVIAMGSDVKVLIRLETGDIDEFETT
jgi:hypothetical protein